MADRIQSQAPGASAAPRSSAGAASGGGRPVPSSDGLSLSGALKRIWDGDVTDPVHKVKKALEDQGKKGGVLGFAAKAGGFAFDLTGVPTIADGTSTALDERLSAGARVKGAAWALGTLALDVLPVAKVTGLAGKAFRLTGGERAVQALRNRFLLGAEVKAGTEIVHYTTAAAADRIAGSGVLRGSERGFYSWGGRARRWVFRSGRLEHAITNNGQVYAVAADGRSTAAGRVLDAVVGVGDDTRLGRVLGKVSAGKTTYGAEVRHVLTPEEAALSRRWGKTIVTRVRPDWKGLRLSGDELAVLRARTATGGEAFVPRAKPRGMAPIDSAIETLANHRGALTYGVVQGEAISNRPDFQAPSA